MKTNRRIRVIFITVMLVCTMGLCGCGKVNEKQADAKIKIVCTMFPQYDWARQIVGKSENVDINMLIKNGGDLHNYQPTADDIITVSDCDIFIYVGGASDKWVKDILEQSTNKDMIVINMMDVIGDNALKTELSEGMEIHEHHHEEDHDDIDDDHHEEDTQLYDEYDEHMWLSISNAKLVCDGILEAVISIDESNKDLYQSNYDKYMSSMDELDGRYREAVDDVSIKTLIVADRFPFLYLTREYGIQYYAAFTGCSSETEASFETVLFLASKLDELNLKSIVCVDGSTQDVARTVLENTNGKDAIIYTLDSMQAVSEERVKNGETYLGIMENNLSVLKEILGNK